MSKVFGYIIFAILMVVIVALFVSSLKGLIENIKKYRLKKARAKEAKEHFENKDKEISS